jgi:hypothetical protein
MTVRNFVNGLASSEINSDNSESEAKMSDGSEGHEEIIISTEKENKSKYYLGGNPISFFVTNVLDIMGGRTNLWKNR